VALQTADGETAGRYDMDTFKAKMAPHLAPVTGTELEQMFMKIDGECEGKVDW